MNSISTKIVIVLCVIVFTLCTWFLIQWSLLPVLVLSAFAPFIFLSLNKPVAIFTAALVTYHSYLSLPGFPGGLTLSFLFMMFFIMIAFLNFLLKSPNLKNTDKFLRFGVVTFLSILVIIIFSRGAGFRAMGDPNWGGFRYVILFTTGLFLLQSNQINISDRQWKNIVILYFVFSAVPFLSEVVFLLSKGRLYYHYYIVKMDMGTASNYADFASDTGTGRFKMAGLFGLSMLSLFYINIDNTRLFVRRILVLTVLPSIFFVLALAGHRQAIFEGIIILVLYKLITSKNKLKLFFMLALGFCTAMILLYTVAPYFPFAVQRAISFLPYINIDPVAKLAGMATLEWRYEVWGHGFNMINDYIWLGKGFTYPGDTLEMLYLLSPGEYYIMWAVETMNFHNGPLSLLVGTGLPGFLISFVFLIYMPIKHLRLQLYFAWSNSILKRMHLVLTLNIISIILMFYFVYGQVERTFPNLFVLFTMLEGISRIQTSVKCLSARAGISPGPHLGSNRFQGM